MSKCVYPCNECKKSHCSYERCAEYCRWLNMAWGEFGRNAPHNYWLRRSDDKLYYIHPEVYRRYLQEGPCGRCANRCCCETPCAKYWHWWDARMVFLRRKFQAQTQTPIPDRDGGFAYETSSARRAMKSLFLGHSEVSVKYSFQTSSLRFS